MVKYTSFLFLVLMSLSFVYSIPIEDMVEMDATIERSENSAKENSYLAEIEACNDEKVDLESQIEVLGAVNSDVVYPVCDVCPAVVDDRGISKNIFYLVVGLMLVLIGFLSYWVWALKYE